MQSQASSGARLLLAALPFLCTCSSTIQSDNGPRLAIPEIAPDTVPPDVSANLAPDGSMARDILSVHFAPGTTLDDKRKAIEAVSGTVIGGVRSRNPRGSAFYIVRIPDPGDKYLEVLRASRDRLLGFPFVANVVMWIYDSPARTS